jgi:hypothetical protein
VTANDDIAIATMTLVRDAEEELLLRRSMEALARHGRRVFVSDGGSGDAFVAFLGSLPSVTVVAPAARGLVGQVRGSLAAAVRSGARSVMYTESDKQAFFESSLHTLIDMIPSGESTGLALAARSEEALSTFPSIQQFTEGVINDLCRRFFGASGDYSYGPFVLPADLVRYIDRAPDDLGWGWRHFLFSVAHRLGRRVRHAAGDYECPDDQRREDDRERLHRLRQLAQNVRGLEAGLQLPL